VLANQPPSALGPHPGAARARDAGHKRSGAAAGAGDGLLLEGARQAERVICRFRYLVGFLAVVMAAGREPFPPVTATVFVLVPVAVNTAAWLVLRRAGTLPALLRLGRWVLAADLVTALFTYLVFLRDKDALPAAFVPLLVFELAVRFEGRRGLLASLGVFTAAVAVRIFFQLRVIPGGAIRWPLLLVWVLLGALIVVLAGELRAQARQRLAAQRDRERVADSFRQVVGEVLTRSGIPPHAATWDDVLTAVRSLCDQEPAECATLAAGIAGLLVPATQAFGLTRREREIIRLLAMDHSYDRIARSLFVSGSTVRNHVHNIKAKLGVSSREEIITFAREHGLAGADQRQPPPRDRGGAETAAASRQPGGSSAMG
jgi:DNA-binding CsgD family transcriptional regulator